MNNVAPVTAGFRYRITDALGNSADAQAQLIIDPGTLYWRTSRYLARGSRGHRYATTALRVARGWSASTCSSCGGDKFTLVAGTLPRGMWLSPLNAYRGRQYVNLGGTPTRSGSYALRVRHRASMDAGTARDVVTRMPTYRFVLTVFSRLSRLAGVITAPSHRVMASANFHAVGA